MGKRGGLIGRAWSRIAHGEVRKAREAWARGRPGDEAAGWGDAMATPRMERAIEVTDRIRRARDVPREEVCALIIEVVSDCEESVAGLRQRLEKARTMMAVGDMESVRETLRA